MKEWLVVAYDECGDVKSEDEFDYYNAAFKFAEEKMMQEFDTEKVVVSKVFDVLKRGFTVEKISQL